MEIGCFLFNSRQLCCVCSMLRVLIAGDSMRMIYAEEKAVGKITEFILLHS